MHTLRLVCLGMLLACSPVFAQDDFKLMLQEVEAQIAKAPDDPMLFYRKAQYQIQLGMLDEGYQTAGDAMALFIKKGDTLAWIMLERIDLGHIRVDVHFNMGPRERKPPESGIIRPLSFRIWKQGEDMELLEIIDFEYGMLEGKPLTAAFGQTSRRGHLNLGMIAADSPYTKIRESMLELVHKRHKAPEPN